MLIVETLHAEIDGKPILNGLLLTVNAREVRASRLTVPRRRVR